MCVSVTPRVRVRFSDTVLYAAEMLDKDGDLVHVLGYQNKVGFGGITGWLKRWMPGPHTGNAMILPLPAEPGTMTKDNVIDTSDAPDILQDMSMTVDPPVQPRSYKKKGRMLLLSAPPVQVFEAAGIYTVVLAQDPRDIVGALDQVPRDKRPLLNPALFDAYARWYPGWTIAFCCFNNQQAKLALPLLWWFEPLRPDLLFLPTVDCHTGDVPDLRAQVHVDHVLVVGSYRLQGGLPFYAGHSRVMLNKEVAPYISERIMGARYRKTLPNGDFVCKTEDVAAGRFSPLRSAPA